MFKPKSYIYIDINTKIGSSIDSYFTFRLEARGFIELWRLYFTAKNYLLKQYKSIFRKFERARFFFYRSGQIVTYE